MSVTRRDLAILLTAATLPASAAPQSASSDEETRSAHEALRNNAQQLAKVDLPMATEPVCHFKA